MKKLFVILLVLAGLLYAGYDHLPIAVQARIGRLFEPSLEELHANAEAGNVEAAIQYGYRLETSSPPDLQNAIKWYSKAAETENPVASYFLGMALISGGTTKGIEHIIQAANKGLLPAVYNLAKIYENGRARVQKNVGEAFFWYFVATRLGHKDAPADLERISNQVSSRSKTQSTAKANQLILQIERRRDISIPSALEEMLNSRNLKQQ